MHLSMICMSILNIIASLIQPLLSKEIYVSIPFSIIRKWDCTAFGEFLAREAERIEASGSVLN